MKKMILLIAIVWLGTGHLHAQVKLADSAWTATSTQQVSKAEFNGELVDGLDNVSISYEPGNMTFTNHTDPSKSFTVAVKYDKTELGVVYFEPKGEMYERVTVQLESGAVVVEYEDQSMVCYLYPEIIFNGLVN